MSLVDARGFNFQPQSTTRGITDALNQVFGNLAKNNRQDKLLAQQQKALDVKTKINSLGKQASFIRNDIEGFQQKRSAVARMAQEAIKDGSDSEPWERILNIQQPDQFNFALQKLALDAVDGEKFINDRLGVGNQRGSGVKFSAPVTLVNKETGEKRLALPAGDPNTGLARLADVDIPEGFELSRETPEEKRIADIISKAKTQQRVGDIKAQQDITKASGVEAAKLDQQLKMKPKIEAAVSEARKIAGDRGQVFTELNQMEAALPGLQETISSLRELAPIATSTVLGRAFDVAVKETGFGATEGATAKAKFIAIINNQVLPLLKPTFGAAFTVQEGESLKATMGDPNASPAEKMAQLDAFMEQKERDIRLKRKQIDSAAGLESTPTGNGLPSVTTQEEFDSLESGDFFIEDGIQYRKP